MRTGLIVTAHLETPPALTWPLMLDAVLLGGLGALRGAEHPSGWADPAEVIQEPLPLALVERGGDWWYACSQITPAGAQSQDFTNRVPMVEEAARLTAHGSLNVAAGPDKRLRTPVYYRSGMLRLTWHCVTDDAHRVAVLLQHVHAIGKMRTHGRGSIRRWEVARTIDVDLDAYAHPGTRHVPAHLPYRSTDGLVTRRHLPLRPPYWMRRDAIECWQEVEAAPCGGRVPWR